MRFLLAVLFLLSALPAHAQNMQRALVVSTCGSQSLAAGPLTNLTMNPQGQLCLNGIGGGGPVPVVSVAPVVTGTGTVGSTLSSTTGTWTNSPTGYAYQWLRNGTPISGATSSTYLLVVADGGTSVGSQVIASNAGGNSAPSASNTIAIAGVPVISVAPVVTGSTTVGSTLSSTTGSWTNSPTGYAYQWFRGGSPISGATSATYLTVSADIGTAVGSQVTASNSAGASLPSTSNTITIIAAPTYTGPGDVVASAVAWWGLRAYSGAYTAIPGKSVNLRRASDNATCDFAVSSTGGLGVSVATCATGLGLTPAAFATQDATASCTIATNTATCTGASSTPHVGSTVAGSGVGQPCYATAVGTFTSGAGTVTLTGGLNTGAAAPCGTIGSAATLTFTYGLYATKLYDQSGATNCTTACDALQATAARQPQLQPTCLTGLPCLSFVAASTQNLSPASNLTGVTTALSMSAVSVRNAAFTTAGRVFSNSGASLWLSYYVSANTMQVYQGTTGLSPTVSDSVWHSLGASFAGGASTFFSLDGVAGSPFNAGTNAWSGTIQLGAGAGANTLNGYATEFGLWGSSLASAQLTSICHNQFGYWGTATSC